MLTREKKLYLVFFLPGLLGLIRVLSTVWYLVKNPLGMPIGFIQLVPMGAVIVVLFAYFKLYSDGIPIISLIAPSILHFILILVFYKKVVIMPFIPLLIIDVIFLAAKGIKAEMFPFDIESDEDESVRVIDELFSEEA